MDCHVLLIPRAIERLVEYYAEHPDTSDLISGPLLMDSHAPRRPTTAVATHFTPKWRGEMEGVWNLAWRCTRCGAMIDVDDQPEQTTTVYRPLVSSGPFTPTHRCPCGNVARLPLVAARGPALGRGLGALGHPPRGHAL